MSFIDTHCHIYLEEFDEDRDAMIQRALANQITKLVLPNVDSATIEPLNTLTDEYPSLAVPLMGLHPTSVEDDYKNELDKIAYQLQNRKYFGIGEIGMDLYWDKTFVKEQEDALAIQLKWALEANLPVVIHTRNSFMETIKVIEGIPGTHRGIFHCFSGSLEEAQQAIDLGFLLGIGGVLTFKNGGMDKVIDKIDPKHLVLETDAPYLAPVPKRGKRNEPAYLVYTAKKLVDIFSLHIDEIARITTSNAQKIFGL